MCPTEQKHADNEPGKTHTVDDCAIIMMGQGFLSIYTGQDYRNNVEKIFGFAREASLTGIH